MGPAVHLACISGTLIWMKSRNHTILWGHVGPIGRIPKHTQCFLLVACDSVFMPFKQTCTHCQHTYRTNYSFVTHPKLNDLLAQHGSGFSIVQTV